MRTSLVPLPSTALKISSGCSVFSELYRITVPCLYSTLLTHSGFHRLWSVLPAHNFLARHMGVFEGAIVQLPAYRRLRTPLPRGWVQRGAGLGRMGRLRATRLCVRGCGFGVPRQEFGAELIQLPRAKLADDVVVLEGILLQVVVLLWPVAEVVDVLLLPLDPGHAQ